MGTRPWAELKTTDFKGGAPTRIALLPVAATEQHGPHLPLGTDAYILEAILARLDVRADVLLLPMQTIGDSLEHCDFPGTLSQRAETLIASWITLGEAVAKAGIQKLALVNSHGGQPQIVDIVAKRLRAERKMAVARINTVLLGVPRGIYSDDELAYGFHGGEVETSMMLAARPDLVDMTTAAAFSNRASGMARQYQTLRAEGPAALAWQAQDLNPAGVTGNAAMADAARGEKTLAHIAGRVSEALADLAAANPTDSQGPA